MACPTIYSLSDSELLTLNKNTLPVPLWLKPLRRFHNRHSNSMRLRKRWSLFGSGTGTDYGDASIVVSGAARRGGHRKWRNDVVYVASREHDPHTIDQVLEISGLDRSCSYPCGFRGSLGASMTISTLPQQKNGFHAGSITYDFLL